MNELVFGASAPGRVNLIGEHTDYNGGFVLPVAIPQRTWIELRKQPGSRISVSSAGMDTAAEFTLGEEAPRGVWWDYVQGATWVLARDGLRAGDCTLRIRSDVPLGAGLSSSAVLCVALLRVLRQAFGLSIDDVKVALLAQKVENGFRWRSGRRDGSDGEQPRRRPHSPFLDTLTLEHERVPVPKAVQVMVIDSGVRHSHATGDYRVRRRECEAAARLLGVRQLHDVGLEAPPRIATLPAPLAQRARHVVTEDARVLAAVRPLRAGDATELGRRSWNRTVPCETIPRCLSLKSTCW